MTSATRLHRLLRPPAAAALLAAVVAGMAAAQTPEVHITGRIQAQYRSAAGDSSGLFDPNAIDNGFEIRRLRIQADVALGDNIDFVIQPSFEMGSFRMLDAYVRVGMTSGFGVTVGQQKSPFQRYELQSSNSLPSIERGLRIFGLSGREALNDLLVDNGYASRDLGAFAEVQGPGGRFVATVGVQNGSRESSRDVNNAKSFFGRATGVAISYADGQPRLQIGASVGARDRAICSTCSGDVAFFPDSSKTTTALGVDVEWGAPGRGLHVVADFATGDNVPIPLRVSTGRNGGNLRNSADSNVVTFRGVSVVASYRVQTGESERRIVRFIDPALRLDVADPNVDTADDAGLLITPVLNIHFSETTVMRVGLDLYRYRETGRTIWARELKVQWQANF